MPEERAVGADRVLVVLSELGRHPRGATLEELASVLGEPKSSVHRALSTLRKRGFALQNPSGGYELGDELLRLAFSVHEQRPEGARVNPVLTRLAERFGETTHFAVLDGGEVVYRAKADPPGGSMRLTSVIGGRNPAHATAVGKVLLAERYRDRGGFDDWVGARSLTARTQATVTNADALWRELELCRARGYALDEQESEVGVECIAVPIALHVPGRIDGAVSVSAIAVRTSVSSLIRRIDEIRDELGSLAVDFSRT